MGALRRHNSPPATSVMDFILRRSDGSRVWIDTVHASLLRSVFLCFVSQVVPPPESFFRRNNGLASLRGQTTSFLLSCTSVIFSTFRLSPVSSFLTWYLNVWPHAHLHFCHFPFLYVGSSNWHYLHPVQHSWLNDNLVWIFPLTCGGIL